MLQPQKQLLKLYNKIDKKTKRIKKICKKGCDDCCLDDIPISFLEYQLIKDFLEKEKIKLDFYHSPPWCYLLKDHRCLVYPVRPLICRLYGFSFIHSPVGHGINFLTCEKDNNLEESLFPFYFPDFQKEVLSLSLKVSSLVPRSIISWIKINLKEVKDNGNLYLSR